MKIILKNVGGSEQIFSLGDKTLIGRAKECTITLPDDERVSRRHAAIIKKGDNYWLTDLRSINGTYLNGERLATHCRLRDQDQIVIGGSSFAVQVGDDLSVKPVPGDEATVFDSSSPEKAQRLSEELNAELDEETQFLSLETIQDLYDVSAAELYFIKGFRDGDSFLLQDTQTSIGRESSNSLCLPCASVSSQHALISFQKQGYSIKDLGSRNGTFVNKLKLTKESLLHPGDQIQIGDVTLRFGDQQAGAKKTENQGGGQQEGRRILWMFLLLVLIGAGAFFLLRPTTITKTPSEIITSQELPTEAPLEKLPERPVLAEQPLNAQQPKNELPAQATAERQLNPKIIISDAIKMYIDGDFDNALMNLEKIHAVALADNDEMQRQGSKVKKGIRDCVSLYKAGRQDYIRGDIEAAVEKWNQVLSCEAGFVDPSVNKTSAISRNIRRMMAEQLYLQVVKFVEEKNLVMAKQYCIEVLKAIPQHLGCLEIQQAPEP